MTMKLLKTMISIKSLARALCTLTILILPAIATAQVKITLNYLQHQGLMVQYEVPPSCQQLRFEKDGSRAALIRQAWTMEEGCFQIDGDHLRRNKAVCSMVRFKVPASVNKITGNPAAFPMGEALYLHTSNYHVDDQCGQVSYTIVAPHISYEGLQARDHVQITPRAEYTFPALLSPTAITRSHDVISYMDPSLPADTQQRIEEISKETISFLKTAMPKANFMMPIIAAANVKHPGDIGFDGDAGNVLRLSLFNWPEKLSPYTRTTITNFVAHEFSHRFQMRDEVDIYPISRVIHEGGGEFLRWYTSLQKGWLSHHEAAQDLDDALSRCFLGTENQPWQLLSAQTIGERQLAYRCGLAAYVYGLANRQNRAPAINNFSYFYERIAKAERPDFFDAIECGELTECHPQWLTQLFTGSRGMQAVWNDFFQQSQLAKQVPPSQAQLDLMTKKAFALLMGDDCGESSYFEARDGLIVDDLKACRTLRKDMKVTGVEGYPLLGNPEALNAMTKACKSSKQVKLQLATKETIQLTCLREYQAPKTFFAVDLEKLLRQLN